MVSDRKSFGSDPVGVSYNDSAAAFALVLGTLQGLTFYSQDRVVLATPEWEYRFEQVRTAFKNGAIRAETSLDPFLGDSFEQGKAAMKFADSNYYQSLDIKMRMSANPFKWTVAPMPNNSTSGSASASIYHVNEIAAISHQAGNREAAEQVLKFIASEKIAKILQERGELATRNIEANNEKVKRFAILSDAPYAPAANKSYDELLASMPEEMAAKFANAATAVMNELLVSDKDTMEGLKEIEATVNGE
ncbi:extracellular solute-binding protein [Paenibacillus xylaniclasticus]|uniref:extracellular solute-binding protein n=1 Tax=Paenibacillus xylaniclasticus TaxID=588083 RepID=UPI000FD7F413|nr:MULTISPECIES: extracellular solute-binding protein [Paenibacillus]GFN30766.1 hypothetical protein PCURB6_10260 [Paenibacillus curdlanolyticus]